MLGPDIHKAFPGATARLYLPAHTKTALRVEEPFQWKGSALSNLGKGKCTTTRIVNHRAIHVASTDGKQFESNARTQLIGPQADIVGPTQFGAGLAGSSCDIAHLHVTVALAFAISENLAAAILFIDLVTAFDAMKRHLAIPTDDATDQC